MSIIYSNWVLCKILHSRKNPVNNIFLRSIKTSRDSQRRTFIKHVLSKKTNQNHYNHAITWHLPWLESYMFHAIRLSINRIKHMQYL